MGWSVGRTVFGVGAHTRKTSEMSGGEIDVWHRLVPYTGTPGPVSDIGKLIIGTGKLIDSFQHF